MRWVDLSAYTGELSASAVDALLANKVEGLAVQGYGGGPNGLGPNPYARQQAGIWLNAGGKRLATYTWPPAFWRETLENLQFFPLDFLALDIEGGVQMTRSHVNGVRERSINCVKYCSPYTWYTDMANSLNFQDVDTWLAWYFQTGWRTWESSVRYLVDGSRTMMMQIQGTTTLADDQFDLNVADPLYFTVVADEEEPDMKLVQGPDGAVYTLGASGLRHVDEGQELSLYVKAFGQPIAATAEEIFNTPLAPNPTSVRVVTDWLLAQDPDNPAAPNRLTAAFYRLEAIVDSLRESSDGGVITVAEILRRVLAEQPVGGDGLSADDIDRIVEEHGRRLVGG